MRSSGVEWAAAGSADVGWVDAELAAVAVAASPFLRTRLEEEIRPASVHIAGVREVGWVDGGIASGRWGYLERAGCS